MKHFFSTLIAVLILQIGYAQIVINEYSGSNVSIINDAFGKSEDFVELYNTSTSPIYLNGYFLSDNAANIMKWQIPGNVTIGANSRLLLFCSGNDLISGGNQIHTKFKLTQCHNNQIIISTPTGVVLDSLTMLRTQGNHSRGRTTDGAATWSVFNTPTPGTANAAGKTAYALRPVFSVAPGFYAGTQVVSLSTTEPNITIRYTSNGLTPTATSPIYTNPINIPNDSVIRAKCFSSIATILPSFTETNTYIIGNTHHFPVISVSGNYNNLFSSGNDITTAVEYFDSTQNFKWEMEGSSMKHGHDSWAYSQKGFRIEAEDELGYMAEMPEKFFINTPRDSFKLVILKAAASDNYDGNTRGAHMRDALVQTFSINHNYNFDERSYNPCIVYVNGRYWGVYEIREKVDLDYCDYYYGQTKSNVDMVQYWGGQNVLAGSDTGWTNLRNFIVNNNMALPANYNYVASKLEVMSLIDFFIYNNYIANSDHMNWNTMWWRGRKGAGIKWRYALWDMDNTFNLGQNFTGLSTTGPELDPCEPFTLFANSTTIFHTQMINGLMNNPTFKKAYKDRYAYLLSTSLTCDTLLLHLKTFEDMLAVEMPQQIARWGGTMQTWRNHVDTIRDFILKRCALVGGGGDSCGGVQKITFNVDAAGMGKIKYGNTLLNTYPHKEVAGIDSIYNIEAIPNAGFRFKTWKKFSAKNAIMPLITSASALLDYHAVDSIVAVFEVKPLDTFDLTLKAIAPYAGKIVFDNVTYTNFPTIIKIVENSIHTVAQVHDTLHKFIKWKNYNTGSNTITPTVNDSVITYTVTRGNDTLEAYFDTVIIIPPYLFPNVLIPNAFTPNKDGNNDYFGIKDRYNGKVSKVILKIFDRFGNLLYDGDGLDTGWDGRFNGEPNELGSYYYSIIIKYSNNTSQEFKGDLLLTR
jgi:gliding motility-associated-like protein